MKRNPYAPGVCPFCEGTLQVEVLRCDRCRTRIEGRFDLMPFHRLSSGDVAFLLRFLAHWGNLSRLSRELGVSYPTVRARYRELLEKMGLAPEEGGKEPSPPDVPEASRVLEALEKGKISVAEALRLLGNPQDPAEPPDTV